MRKIIILLLISCNLRADGGLSFLSQDEIYVDTITTIKSSRRGKKLVSNQDGKKTDRLIKSLMRQNTKLEEILERRSSKPFIMDDTIRFDFVTGTTFRGTLLNSIVSTNLGSPILIQVFGHQGLPAGTKFACKGTSKHKRVVSACNLMILPKEKIEIEVNTSVLERDGSAGIRPDEIYSGKDLYVASSLANSFARGLLEAGKDHLITPYGQIAKSTLKNKLLSGLIETSNDANEQIHDEIKEQATEAKLFINAGKEVIIYFNKRLQI